MDFTKIEHKIDAYHYQNEDDFFVRHAPMAMMLYR